MAKLEQPFRFLAALEGVEVRSAGAHGACARGVFTKLSVEHAEAAVMLERLAQTSDIDLRRGLFFELRDKLLAHEEAELMELYPHLRRDPRIVGVDEARTLRAWRPLSRAPTARRPPRTSCR